MIVPPLLSASQASPVVVDEDADGDQSAYFSRRAADQYRFVYGHDRPSWYSWELTGMDERYGDDVWAHYTEASHKPILLIRGERDGQLRADVRDRFDLVVQPKERVVLRGADHYFNTAQSLGLVFYDIVVARQLSDVLASWIPASN